MLLLFTGLSLRAYAEDDGGSPFRKNHDVDLTVKSATLQTFTDAFTKQTGVLFSYESALGIAFFIDLTATSNGYAVSWHIICDG